MPLAEISTIPPRRRANKAELAQFFDIDPRTVEKWIGKGAPVVQHGEKGTPWVFDVLAVALWKYAPAVTPNQETDAGEFDPEKLAPKDRKDWFESEIKRRDLQVRDGELIPSDEVARVVATAFASIAQSMRSLPDDLERRFALDPDTVEALAVAIDDHMDALADRLVALGAAEGYAEMVADAA